MAADVVEGANLAAPVPEDDDALEPDLSDEICARAGDLLFPAHAQPAAEKDLLPLLGEDRGVGEVASRKGMRAGERDVSALDECGHGGGPEAWKPRKYAAPAARFGSLVAH